MSFHLHRPTRPTLIQFAFALLIVLVALLSAVTLTGCGAPDADAAITSSGTIVPVHAPSDEIIGQEVAVLTEAPNVPPQITRNHATIPSRVLLSSRAQSRHLPL